MKNEKDAPKEFEHAGRTTRRDYVTPGIVWEEPIDVAANLASACNKNDPGGISCTLPPLS